MSGMTLSVLPPTTFDFHMLQTGAGNSVTFNIAQRIDLSGYESGVLVVRQHTGTFQTASEIITVNLYAHGYTPDDPGTDFGQAGSTLATAIALSTSGTFYQTSQLSAPFTGLARIAITGQIGTLGNSCTAKISIDLVLKTGGDARAMAPRMPGAFQGYR